MSCIGECLKVGRQLKREGREVCGGEEGWREWEGGLVFKGFN